MPKFVVPPCQNLEPTPEMLTALCSWIYTVAHWDHTCCADSQIAVCAVQILKLQIPLWIFPGSSVHCSCAIKIEPLGISCTLNAGLFVTIAFFLFRLQFCIVVLLAQSMQCKISKETEEKAEGKLRRHQIQLIYINHYSHSVFVFY